MEVLQKKLIQTRYICTKIQNYTGGTLRGQKMKYFETNHHLLYNHVKTVLSAWYGKSYTVQMSYLLKWDDQFAD